MSKLTDSEIQQAFDMAIFKGDITTIKIIDLLRDAERRLQVPVKIPDIDAFDYNPYGYLYKDRYISALEIAIKTAGFKVEG